MKENEKTKLRRQAAIAAMHALLINYKGLSAKEKEQNLDLTDEEYVAGLATQFADALLEKL